MERKHEQILENQEVKIDGFHWSDSSFTNCTIILEKGLASLTNCKFNNCKLSVVTGSPAISVLQIYELFNPGSIKIKY